MPRVIFIAFGLFVSSMFFPLAASGAVEEKAWPPARQTAGMTTVEYVDLRLALPSVMVGRIVVLGVDWPNLAIGPSNSDRVMHFGVMSEFASLYDLFRKRGLVAKLPVKNAEGLFDAAGAGPNEGYSRDELELLRKSLGLDGAEGYVKFVKKPFIAYRVVSREPGGQLLYVLVDGSEHVYRIAGALSDSQIDALLGNISRVGP